MEIYDRFQATRTRPYPAAYPIAKYYEQIHIPTEVLGAEN